MGQVTRQINDIRLDEKKSVKKIFAQYPHLVEPHKEEMWKDWENCYLLEDDPREYVLFRPREKREKKLWKENQ